MIDLDWYQSFIAVYRTGSVSRAAQARFLTQPAVSQHLAALEAAVGQALFQRLPRKMVPTDRGKKLYVQVAQAIDSLEQTSQNLRAVYAEKPHVRIGAPPEYFGHIVLRQLQPLPLRFTVHFGTPQTLIPLLEQGELDVVIATQRQPAMSVDYRALAEEDFLLVSSMQHPLPPQGTAENARLAMQQWLEEQPWISYGADLPIIRRFWQQSFQTRPTFQPVVILPDLRIIMQAVEQGYGLSILPEYLCRVALTENRIRIVWQPAQLVSNELWLAARRIDRHRQELQQIFDALQASSKMV